MADKLYIEIKPDEILKTSFDDALSLLKSLIGETKFQQALNFEIKSPLVNQKSSDWLKSAKIVGINPRITKTYFGIIKYAMTFPEDAVHIMPLWESGDGSLYVQNCWRLNKDFYDYDLESLGLSTCEKQLKFTVNILHALGKAVGFDTMPHVDNFSEIVMLNPDCFEWVRLNYEKNAQDFTIETQEISKHIKQLIKDKYNLPEDFYGLSEEKRTELLFPADIDRFNRRMEIRSLIREDGYEPIPVVEHTPMRPIKFIKIEYSKNDNWAVFDIDNRDKDSIILGAITPYKFYHIKSGYPEKNKFDEKALNYFIDNINRFQAEYDFDFFRADMAHNQISQSHIESDKDMTCKEVWALLKSKIQSSKPYFGTFAESFFANYYISGLQDMINKNFDIVLGELNYKYMNRDYVDLLYKYTYELKKYPFKPSLTVFTNDGDIEEHDNLFVSLDANICRYFVSMFLNMPSYTGIGFELRDLESENPNRYSNYYIKQQKYKYEFGNNNEQFEYISKIRELYQNYKDIIKTSKFEYYDKRDNQQLAWSYETKGKVLLCAVNLNPDKNTIEINISAKQAELIYTNSRYNEINHILTSANQFEINDIYLGEFVIYELE